MSKITYARYYGQPCMLRRELDGGRGDIEQTLIFIENLWGKVEGSILGAEFTYLDFRTEYYRAALITEEHFTNAGVPSMNALKSRFYYLWQEGYFARTKDSWDYWEVSKLGLPMRLGTDGLKARTITPSKFIPESSATSDDDFMERIREATKVKDKSSTPDVHDDEFLRNLLKTKE